MGTTADKLNKILETKQAIRQAIITKGVDVGEDTKFADYPSRIAAIQTGSGEGSSDAFFNMRTQNGTNFNNLFYGYTGSELDLSDWDTSQVGNMNDVFSYCTNLTSLNLNNWDTNNVTGMCSMFNNCTSLSSLDLSHFNISNVTDMGMMFFYCTGLASLNLNNWDTRNITNMNSMFYSCGNLQSLDLSSFDTSNVNGMNSMFDNCSSLKELNISGFNTSNVNDMSNMFAYCYGLKSLDLSHFNTSNVTSIDSMFAWCYSLEELDIRNFNVNNIEYVNYIFEGCRELHKLRLDNCNYDTINKIINSAGFPTGTVNGEKREIYCTENSSASIEQLPDGWKFVHVESGGGEPGMPTPGIPGGGDEPEVPTDPSVPEEPTQTYQVNFSAYNGTGGNAKKLTVNNVDVSDQVVEVNRFEDTCSYRYETTEPITQVSFKDNTDLIRLFSLDSSNITDMSEMFDGCTSFVGIVSYIDCGAVTNMNYMFRNCTSLSSIPDSYFTSMANVMDMTGMYYNCSNMTGTVEASKYWNNAMIGGYGGCFHNCTSLDNYSEIPMDWGGPDDSE